MRAPISLMVVLAAGALLAACEESRPAAPSPPPAAAAQKAAAPAEKPVAAPVSTYVYAFNPIGKRDPFRSPVEELRIIPGNSMSACDAPLCQWDLDQLTLVAVVTGDASPVAMVEDPQGRGFVVRRSAQMGKQGGKVTNILRDSITVTEYFTTPDGKVTAHPVTIKLKSEPNAPPNLDLGTGKLIQ